MDKGERDRFNKLSLMARSLLAVMASYANAGVNRVSLNDFRLAGVGDSRSIMAAMLELAARAYGRVDHDDVNPIFIMVVPQIQSLAQIGKIQTG